MRRLLDRAVAASSNGILITDARLPDNPIVYVNPAFERISGYSLEESRGRNCRFLQGDDRDQPALDELRRAIREGEERRVVLRNYRKDGTPFWNELYVSPVFDEAGRLTNFVGVQNDITERKRVQEALRKSEQQLRALFESTQDAILIAADSGEYVDANDAACGLFGVSREQLLGSKVEDFARPEEREEVRRAWRVFLERGEMKGEFTLSRPDGVIRNLEFTARAGFLPGRNLSVLRDVTDRKRAQEELRESEERFRATFEHAAVGAAQVGTDGRWLRVNRRLCEIVGYEEDELLGLTFQDITHPEDLAGDLGLMRRMLEGEIPTYSIEKRYVRKDGPTVWVNLTVSLVRDTLENPKYFIAVVEDISERKKAEEERDLLLVREQLARAEAVAARRRLTLLAEVGPIFYSSLDYEATLGKITRLIVPELADWCLLDICEEDGYVHQLAAAHADPEKEKLLDELREHRRFGEDDAGSTAQVLRTRRSALVPEVPENLFEESGLGGEYLRIIRELNPRSVICVPLLARGRALGAITLVSSTDRVYGEEDLAFAENLSYRCALAVDNSRLNRDRTKIARTLQRSLLPPELPEIPRVEVGAEYLPMGEENEVGGDFYDLIDTRYDGWVCVIGDVRGKGAEAAAVTALARYTIRAVVMQKDKPSEVLAVLNEAMLRQVTNERFCTVACVRIEPQDGAPGVALTVSRGGHPPPLLLRGDGRVEEVGRPGKVLGVFDDAELADTYLRLHAGETLFLYTDGVTEARAPEGSFFGEKRLKSFLSSCSGVEAPMVAQKVKDIVLEFQEGYARDDLAVLVLRVPG